ncbi:copper amine oxidase N-terminal domain-containing protein [Paenibacillus radicis (ex Xue et al. 2023)]|uniref:Copper amine oxidase N-terminal domain-containing protein n=1 Tax=Paenibacillus radicis (ex Xue et al. 2023) TaxID=2972489 RepID=A0ABT1YNT5_9BACL|nr:copper amine oxidase N-terminal domain-containing protein [Paenibacillus radicis (ex Xue et al. 2023)]MCR8634841.1 copper amine oxidase N-terminal domain-containing protein [Paenibacillus radicis (ex Xue et al. 2023)]
MKRKSVVLLLLITAVFCLATGAYAASNLTAIQAYLNGEVKFLKDGENWRPTDDNGNEVLPITYEGTTYLPLRVVANVLNIPVSYNDAEKMISLGEGKNVSLYSKQMKTEYSAAKFFDVIDKKQLIFGGKQYNEAFAFSASPGENYSLKIDFGQKYSTLHLIVVAKATMKMKVYNGAKQQLSDEISLVEGEVKEVNVDLKGSQYAEIHPYYGYNSNLSDYPLLYVLKDSFVK